jgi:uncharacterized protein (TIGR03435 family)
MRAIRVWHFRFFEVICATVILLCGTQAHAHGQTTPETIAFEVATIKPVAEYNRQGLVGVHVGLTSTSYISMSLQALFAHAYGVGYFQISGPKWVNTDLYDVVGKFPEGASQESERRRLQALLRDRFQLRFHVEKQEVKAYALVVGKNGTKLKKSIALASDDNTPLRAGEQTVGQGRDKHRELAAFDLKTSIVHAESTMISMNDFAKLLTSILRQTGGKDTVVDRTGLEGDYQLALDYPMAVTVQSDDSSDAPSSDPVGRSTLTHSLDKLGLRLVKQNAQVDYYVFDHVEKPSEN